MSEDYAAEPASRSLRRLARYWGVQTAYYDVSGQKQRASHAALSKIVAALGADVPADASDADFDALADTKRDFLLGQLVEPVTVAWNGAGHVRVRAAEDEATTLVGAITAIDPLGDDGDVVETWTTELKTLPHGRAIEGRVAYLMELPVTLESGYYRLSLRLGERRADSLVLSAPETSWKPEEEQRLWGVFTPLYALHSEESFGLGDLSDLEALSRWTAELGGNLVATLPLLPPQSVHAEDPSPYSPGSRQFWNDLYLDIDALPELKRCEAAQERMASADFQDLRALLNGTKHVDYQRVKRLRTELLGELAKTYFAGDTHELDAWVVQTPNAVDYAQFQAACEVSGKTWFEWTGGEYSEADCDREVYERHLYAQFRMACQLDHLGQTVADLGLLWYLDYPLGVNAAGYDVWKNRSCFVLDCSGGAPPDGFFTKGQNWGFPPMHPEGLRQDGYRYLLSTIRHHLASAKLLRFDHVMGLARLFFVPHGLDARDGAYVKYRVEELFALLCIESHRAQAQIVGENLGTVPPVISAAMDRHEVMGMSVLQFNVRPHEQPPICGDFVGDVTSINTHDTPTFAAFIHGTDIDERVDLGILAPEHAGDERGWREIAVSAMRRGFAEVDAFGGNDGPDADLVEAALRYLSRSQAPIVLTSLDDLLDELEPQNTPGTYLERPNWRRKLAKTLEAMKDDEAVIRRLRALAEARS